MNKLLFTYGTLMKGQCRSFILNGCEFLGDAILNDYGILDIGPYPAAIPMKGYKVFGEVYIIDEDLKKDLDQIEGEGYLYKYKEVEVILNDKRELAGFYEFLKDDGSYKIMEPVGKWKKI